MSMRYTDDPKKAPIGTAFVEVCFACGMETGSIIIKKRGPNPKNVTYTGSMHTTSKDTHCEFCTFLGAYFAHVGKEEGRKYGASKLVEEGGKLIAFAPFTDVEDRDKQLADGTPFRMNHGTVVECLRDDGGWSLVKVLDPGHPE